MKNYSLGIDIGGSHISCAVVDLDERHILEETLSEMPVDNKGEADEIISAWTGAISKSLASVDPEEFRGIGFAMPGPFDYVNGICLIKGVPKYEKLYGMNIGNEIRSILRLDESIPVRFMNDASSFAVGEAWAGKAADSKRSMAVTLGTGLGSAFIENKVPVVKGDNVPELGCVYHINYKEGIADDYFSTRWFTTQFKSLTGREVSGVKEVYESALSDASIRSIFSEFGQSFGSFLSPYLKTFGAEVLVLGGNISRAYDLFGPDLEAELSNNNCATIPRVSELMEDSALLGSACLLEESFWESVKDMLQYM